MRTLRRIGIAIILLATLALAWEPTRVGIQTAVLLPNLLDAGPKPLNLFSEAPRRSSVPYRTPVDGADPDLAELWLPAGASADRPAGAMLLVFGVNNLGRNHPSIERVADGLARTGVAVLVPDSRTLLEGRLEVGEIDGVVRAFQLLAARPEVDRARVGIVGFSVGGSLALLAAADPRIASQVSWVNAFGAFADARTYLASVASHSFAGEDGSPVPWTPSPLAREVFLRFVLDQVDDADDADLLRRTVEAKILDGQRPEVDMRLRTVFASAAARAAYDLLTAPSLQAASDAIEALPRASRAFMDAISPRRHLAGLQADVFLMHEVEDRHVPFVESRALAQGLVSAGLLERHTEFRLFDHVQPDDLDLLAAAPELVKLLFHVRELLEESL